MVSLRILGPRNLGSGLTRSARSSAGALPALLLVACGANAPDVPPELLQQTDGGSSVGGTEVGQVAANVSFDGWMDGTGKTASDPMQRIGFPDVATQENGLAPKVILVNFSAEWCTQCKEEHSELPAFYALNRERGLRVFTLIYENSDTSPADAGTVSRWANAFGSNFPIGMDPERIGSNRFFGGSGIAPFNIVIDAQTMRITEKLQGGDILAVLNDALNEG